MATTTTTTTNALNNNNHQHLLHALKPGSNNNINVQSINLAGVQGAVANLPTLQSIQVLNHLKTNHFQLSPCQPTNLISFFSMTGLDTRVSRSDLVIADDQFRIDSIHRVHCEC